MQEIPSRYIFTLVYFICDFIKMSRAEFCELAARRKTCMTRSLCFSFIALHDECEVLQENGKVFIWEFKAFALEVVLSSFISWTFWFSSVFPRKYLQQTRINTKKYSFMDWENKTKGSYRRHLTFQSYLIGILCELEVQRFIV